MLFIDRLMVKLISIGGIAIIAAVFGILAFIAWQVIPLFGQPDVEEQSSRPLPPANYLFVGLDEWGELPFSLADNGDLVFSQPDGEVSRQPLTAGAPVSAFVYRPKQKILLIGLDDRSVIPVRIDFEREFVDGTAGEVRPLVEISDPLDLKVEEGKLTGLAFAESDETRIIAALVEVGDDGHHELKAYRFTRKQTLLGTSKFSLVDSYDLGDLISGDPEKLAVSGRGDMVIVANSEGTVFYLHREGDAFALRQTIEPFADQPAPQLATLDFLIGDATLAMTDTAGLNRNFSLFIPEGGETRLFGQTKEFATLGARPIDLAPSLRSKSFLLVAGKTASLRHHTTNDVRWEGELDFQPAHVALNQKHNRVAFLDTGDRIHLFELDDPHPEAGWQAYFGKIWYEDSPAPDYTWQSTGGSDAFEPKLSLMPLIFGTLKGTLYALLFAIPIAILAAIYTSQFLSPRNKAIVKPTMEIMASLPSVVLGFLGALWLAPLIEKRTPSLALMVIFIPTVSFLIGWWWSRLPIPVRRRIPPGREFLVFAPILILISLACWHLGPVVEKMMFGGDFTRWWYESAGMRYEQRNCLIIGIMMGFAVIPIIFTITEDALSSVPDSLRSASLALGGSRWQTAWRIVLPTASAGIFSAVMIGLGRAIGETMIVTMATGNTPIMELNLFSGMRTLSANIATELPEAPEGGTLYRTLFLGAMVLFLLTFILNTIAEVMRQHLREKYKTV